MDPLARALAYVANAVGWLNGGQFIVQKAYAFVKYHSFTPPCDGGRGFDDSGPGTEQEDQDTETTPINKEKLQEALRWQPPQETAVDGQADLNRKWADIRQLEQIVEMESPGTSKSVVKSIPSPSFSRQMQGRLASSFRSYSVRCILRGEFSVRHESRDIPDMPFLVDGWNSFFGYHLAGLAVTYCVQLDVVDDHARHPTSTLGKRVIGGKAVDYFGQLSSRFRGDTSRGNGPLQAKIPGVRFRKRDSRYVAQVKPPGASGSVHIAQFKSLPEAARAQDVGWYLYHRDKVRMHFDDTPQLILTELASTGRNAEDELSRIAGLSKDEKLKFVQELAKKIVQAHPVELPSLLPRNPSCATEFEMIGILNVIAEMMSADGLCLRRRDCTENITRVNVLEPAVETN